MTTTMLIKCILSTFLFKHYFKPGQQYSRVHSQHSTAGGLKPALAKSRFPSRFPGVCLLGRSILSSNAEHQPGGEETPYLQARCRNAEGPTQRTPRGSASQSLLLSLKMDLVSLPFLSPFPCFCPIPVLIAFIL